MYTFGLTLAAASAFLAGEPIDLSQSHAEHAIHAAMTYSAPSKSTNETVWQDYTYNLLDETVIVSLPGEPAVMVTEQGSVVCSMLEEPEMCLSIAAVQKPDDYPDLIETYNDWTTSAEGDVYLGEKNGRPFIRLTQDTTDSDMPIGVITMYITESAKNLYVLVTLAADNSGGGVTDQFFDSFSILD